MYFYESNTQESSDDCLNRESICSDYTGTKSKFIFPPPPRLIKSANNSYCSTASDSSNSGVNRSFVVSKKKRHRQGFVRKLPPLGIYWDIENCQVPKNKSASSVVQKIREVFLENYREAEFIVVCDVKKENPQIIEQLHDSQVNLIHVSSTSKNAADEKLRQSLRRFAEVHSAPSGIVLISGDINFAADLADLRYRKKIRVILVHLNVAEALILCANEHHSFTDLMKDLPEHKNKVRRSGCVALTVVNLPLNFDVKRIKNRLRMLVENCGGKVWEVSTEEGFATVRFGNIDAALRAQRRIQGEDVFGSKIKVLCPSGQHLSGRKSRSTGIPQQVAGTYGIPPPPPGFTSQDFGQNYSYFNQSSVSNSQDSRRQTQDLNSQQGTDSYMFRPIRGLGISNVSPMDVSYDQSWGSRRSIDRRPRTPQEQTNIAMSALSSRSHKISGSSEFSDDGKMCYSSESDGKSVQSNQPVDLIISNLDPTIDIKELRRLLTNMLKEYAMILSLNITLQADGTLIANIRVNSQQEAQYSISQLHRQKLGHKRIVISYAQNNSPDPEQLRSMVIGILQEVPDKCMPLFKFIELLESRYHCTVSVSEVNKLKDICKITDDLGSRIISLTQEVKASPPPNLSRTFVPYCIIHCPNGLQSRGWCELSTIEAPNIMMSLQSFASKLTGLLKMHMGCMPLLSFQVCYEQEYHEPLPVDDNGVPLEHLISCVPNMEIKFVGPNKNIKVVKYDETRNLESDEDAVLKTVPPPLAPNISLLCREVVDLLKTTEKCQLLLSKFIPAYHHHFGRQCRVADYGYTKLLDLFESITHVVQIMGDGIRRVITLSHNAQMRRFTSDLLRVLKVQPSKLISIIDFPSAYEKVMNKIFNAVEYGLCTFEDLLQEVPDNTIIISKNNEGIFIAVPKREQTAEEIMRTKQFSIEVIDLLRHSPYYTMLFYKFVPAYHHHFGYQCKVSHYGFTKLIELFEAIPDIVKIDDMPDGERTVSLTLQQSLKVLGSQIVQIIKASKQSALPLEEVPRVYLREYGYPLKPQLYECDTVADVAKKLSDYVQIINGNAGTLLVAIDMDTIPNTLILRSWALLIHPPHCKDLATFRHEYQSRYNNSFSMDTLQQFGNVISISSSNDTNFISLTVLYILAAQLYHIIYNNGGSVLYINLERLYFESYGKPLKLSHYHIYSVDEFYNNFNLLFFIRGSKKKSIVVLNRNLAEHLVPLPPAMHNSNLTNSKKETINWPPPPPPEMVQSTVKKVSPPKPDTPPTPGSNLWNHWNPTSTFEQSLNLSIHLPIAHNPKLLGNPKNLISPARHLLPADGKPWNIDRSSIEAPDPAELPMPDKLMSNGGGTSDEGDSGDSGVNIKLDNSPSDNENDVSAANSVFGGAKKKKPTFATLLNFNN